MTLPLVGVAITGLVAMAIAAAALRDEPALWVLGAAILAGATVGGVAAVVAVDGWP